MIETVSFLAGLSLAAPVFADEHVYVLDTGGPYGSPSLSVRFLPTAANQVGGALEGWNSIDYFIRKTVPSLLAPPNPAVP